MIFKQGLKKCMRLIALTMAICMLGSALLVSAASAASPADIRGAWSEKTMLEWIAKGWLSGFPDGTVRPKQEVKRVDFFTLANRSLGFSDEADIAFSDVRQGSWVAKQVAIAVQAGYDGGYPDGTMQPHRSVTREEAAIMVAKAFGLQPKPAETSVFTDTASISNEGRGAVGALVASGILKGYPDGTFNPHKVITREEAVVILDGALKKLDRRSDKDRTFSTAGTYGPASGTERVAGNVVVAAAGVTLRNLDIQGDLLLSADIGEGDASLDNVKVEGMVTVNGGGPNSIHLKDSQLETLIVDKYNGNVRITAKGSTTVKRVDLRSGSKLESEAAKDRGFRTVHLTKEMPAGSKVSLLGEFPSANVASSNVELELLEGAIRALNVLSGASGNTLKLEEDTQIDELSLEEETTVQGQGAIDRAIIVDRAKDSKFEREPGKLEGDIVPLPGTGGGGGNSDTTPPAAPAVTGVLHEQIYIAPVTPNWVDVPGTTSTATLSKSGSPQKRYTKNTEISEDGSYVLSVTAKKNSNGLSASTTIYFTIDSVPPAAPVIEGISDGGRYFSALPSWADAPGTVSAAMLSKDGHAAQPYEHGTLIEEEGNYVLTITATKTSNGLTAAMTIRFTIDYGAVPAVIEGVQQGRTYPYAMITWVDASGMQSSATLAKDGGAADPFVSGTTVTEDGDYILTVTTRNVLSSQTVEQQIHFAIIADLPAAAEIVGVADGRTYAGAVVSWVDAPDMASTATIAKDGGSAIPFVSGTAVTEDGSYVLTVTTGWHVNAKTVQQRIAFMIDSVPPLPVQIGLTGVQRLNRPGVYNNAKLHWTDSYGTQSAATLQRNGAEPVPYEMNSLVDLDGDYVLTVTTTKLSNGLTARATRSFAVDVGPARPILSGFADKGIYFEPVTMSWDPYENTTLKENTMTNLTTGEYNYDIPNPTILDSDGTYHFTIGVSRDGWSSTYGYRFVIAGIKGVSEGGAYRSVKPNWIEPLEFDGASYSRATLSRDEGAAEPYTKGTVIDERGEYELTVTWHTGTKSADQASKSVRFAIDPDAPMPVEVTGVEHGRTYLSATPAWLDAPSMTSTATLVKGLGDAVPYASGTEIAENGNYVLKVTTVDDSNGRMVEQEIPFVIDADPPAPVEIRLGLDRRQLPSGKLAYYTAMPAWTDWKQTSSTAMISKNGSAPEPFMNGTVINLDGDYELTVTTTKLTNGLTATATSSFKVDVGAAAPILSGIADKGIYFEPVTLLWEAFPGTTISEVSLEDVGTGEVTNHFSIGTTIADDGTYELAVTVQKDTVTHIYKYRFSMTGIRGIANGQTYVSATPGWLEPIGFGSSVASIRPVGSYSREYTKGTPIVEDGEYMLTVTWRVAVNNNPTQTVSFTIDSVPPGEATIAISGNSRVLSGETAYYSAGLTWTEPTGTTATAMLRKDGAEPVPYTMGALIDQDGDYELIVTTLKRSNGLTSTATRTFHVDTGPVQPALTGFADNAILFGPAVIAWTPREGTQIDWVRLDNLNTNESDEPSSPTTLEQFGEYEFSVGVRKGQEITSYDYRFMIAGISGVEEGGKYASATPDWLEPQHFGRVEAILTQDSGSPIPYLMGETIYEPGEYVLTVTWFIDESLSESKSIRFTIESPPSGPLLTGFSDKAILFNPAEIAWAPRSGTEIVWANLLHRNKNSGITNPATPRTIDEAGEYELTLTVNEGQENVQYAYSFIVAELTGVEEGGRYTKATARWYEPAYFGNVEAVLTKEGTPTPYVMGTEITELGEYVLTVTWRTDNGQSETKSIHFTIVPLPPAPHLTGFSDNAILFGSAEIAWAASEGTQIDYTRLTRKNGNSGMHNPPSPWTVTVLGEYVLSVYVNQDGVQGEHPYQFMLVDIQGVEEDGEYDSATPVWYEPQYFGTAEATLAMDGGSPTPYAKGVTINEAGEYVLTVTWRTDAGTSESKSIRFTIVSTPLAP